MFRSSGSTYQGVNSIRSQGLRVYSERFRVSVLRSEEGAIKLKMTPEFLMKAHFEAPPRG